ncbi:MAG: hypothetical protein ACLRUJ_01495 [Megasphaera micronuciformis]
MVRISFEGTSHEVLQEMKDFLSMQSAHTEMVEPSKAEPPKKEAPPKAEKPKKAAKKETPKDDRQEELKPVEEEKDKETEAAKLSSEDLVNVRQDVVDFTKKDAANHGKVKAWITENLGDGARLTDLTIDKVDSLYDMLGIPKHE